MSDRRERTAWLLLGAMWVIVAVIAVGLLASIAMTVAQGF